jgi:hypothetical protein
VKANQIPRIAAIQRTNIVLVTVTAAALAIFVSPGMAAGCLLGGGVVIANLYLLSILGSVAIAAAGGGATGASKFAVVAIPLKVLIVVGLVYLIFLRVHINGIGFGLGVLTQMAAIFIETGRASIRSRS